MTCNDTTYTTKRTHAALRLLLLLLLMMTGVKGAWGQTETTLLEYGTNDVPWTADRLAEWTAGGSPTIKDDSYVEITGDNGSYATSKELPLTADAVLHVKAVWRGSSNTGRAWSDNKDNGSYFRFGNIVIAQNDQDQKHGYTFGGLSNMHSVTTFQAGLYRMGIGSSTWLLIEMEINTATNKLKSFTIKSEDGNTTYVTVSDQQLSNANYSTVEFGYNKSSSVSYTNIEDLKSIKITSTPICEWSATDKTIAVTDVGQNNPNVVAGLPTLTVYDSGATSSISYSTSDGSVASFSGSNLLVKKPGNITVTATCGTYTANYALTVTGTAATTSSTTFSTSHKYDEWKLTSAGTLTVPTTIDLDYIDMSFGYTGETAVAVSDGAYGHVLKIIDTNGYSHANTTGDVLSENAYGGTFYKFVTTVTGTLQVTGRMSSPVLLNSLSTASVVGGTTYDGNTFTAANLPAGTYYLYNSSYTSDGSVTATALMSGFRFTLPEQSLSFAWNDNPVKYNGEWMVPGTTITANVATNATVGGGAITYSSSNPDVATVDANTGAFTMLKGGHTVITATAAVVPGLFSETSISYALDLNVDKKWVFDNDLGANILATNKESLTNAGLTLTQVNDSRWIFVSGSYVQMGVDCCIAIPNLTKGQVVEIVSHAGHNNTIDLTNALDVNSHTDKTSEGVKDYKSTLLYVKEDGTLTMTGKSSNDTYIHAIYVYTAAPVTTTMEYNSGVNLQQGGGNAFVTDIGHYTRTSPSTILDSNLFDDLCDFSSNNTAIVTVNTSTGMITPMGTGTTTITAISYPVAEYATTYAPAVATATVTVESSTAKSSKTIAVSDLMYLGMASAKDGGLDRTIPNFNITVTGGDKVMTNSDGTHLVMNGGTIRITPRYVDPEPATKVYITNAVAYYSDGTAQMFSNGSNNLQYIDLKKRDKEITHIYVEYKSSDGVTDVSTLLNNAKVTPYISSGSYYKIEQGYKMDYINPTITPQNLRGVWYDMNHLNNPDPIMHDGVQYITAVNIGKTELKARFYESAYFNAVPEFVCLTMEVVGRSSDVPAITFPEKLYLDPSIYPSLDINGFVLGNEIHEPSATINGVAPIGYSVTYSSSDKSIAYPGNDGTKIHTGNKTGRVTITATFMPNDPTTNAVISAKYQLQVLDGIWDFREFKQSTWASMNWSSNGKGRWRDTENFEPFLKDGTSPLDLALGLQSKYKIRLMYDDHGEQNGFLELWGNKDSPYYETNNGIGSILRVPVREGMVVEINARCSGEHADMNLDGLNDWESHTPTNIFYVDGISASQYFIANRNGYFEISNPSVNLFLYINYIRITSEIEFKYGKDTYVKSATGAVFTNPVINQGTSSFTYELENTKNVPAVSINSATGEVTLGSGVYGQFEVTANATGGQLDDKSAVYTATVLAFGVSNHSENISGNSKTFDLREAITTLNTGNIFGADNSPAKAAAEAAIRNKVTFRIVSKNTIATLDGNDLTIEGAGTVTLKAILGAIEEEFTYNITGASIGYYNGVNDVACPNPVIKNDENSYTIKIIGSGTNTTFHLKRMKDDVMGDIRSSLSSLTFSSNSDEYVSRTLTISGFDNVKKGGVIPIYASYEFNSQTYELEGTLTIAYTEHAWRFQHNLLTGLDATAVTEENGNYTYDTSRHMESDYGSTHGLTGGLAQWTSTTGSKTAHWGTGATIDEPTDNGDHASTHDWKFVRKMGITHPESASIYYYNHNVEGSNALVIPETEGLVINSTQTGQQLGVEMMNNNGVVNEPYDCRNLMMLRGGRITIPKVKPGQWVEVRWTRHRDDLAERLMMQNLCDVDGTYINEVYKIGNCHYEMGASSTSSYLFKAAPLGVARGDGTYVTDDDNDGLIDVTFEVVDNVYISIQRIELHAPDWDYHSSMADTPNHPGVLQQVVPETYGVGNIPVWPTISSWNLVNDKYVEVYDTSTDQVTTSTVQHQYVTNGEDHYIYFGIGAFQNGINAPMRWTVSYDNTLSVHDDMQFKDNLFKTETDPASTVHSYKDYANYPYVKYRDGWGKAYVTLTSYSQNERYVANRHTWVITIGKQPQQEYPYTWDFTKYFSDTKSGVGGSADNTYVEDPLYDAVNNPTGAHEWRKETDSWTEIGNSEYAKTDGYNTPKYKSYFVDRAQLVSTGTNGPLPETAGLGFSLNDKNTGGLTLGMVDGNVPAGGVQANGSGETWRDGSLTITGGGTIIVPMPVINYGQYYIYINSSVKPSSVTHATDISTAEGSDVDNDYNDTDNDGHGTFKYTFTGTGNAEFTFSGDATVYAIGVTDKQKTLTKIGGTAWATESRDCTIDHALTGYLTTNDANAYAIIERNDNPTYTADKTKTTVAINDERFVVPANTGLVMKQTTGLPTLGENVTTYNVPLFVPAVTTATDDASAFNYNLMRPNINATELTDETESFEGINGSATYTRFILAKRYATWAKGGNTVTPPTAFESQEAAVFYRLHHFGDTFDGENADQLNTLGANKAYLLLLTSSLPAALWNANSPTRSYVGILGVSDMEENFTDENADGFSLSEKTYNLKGQLVNTDGALPPGVYIRNGKKIIIK